MKRYVFLTAAVALGLALSGTSSHAQSTQLPILVAYQAFPNQSTPIPQTTLVTPGVGGLFRISFYMEGLTTGGEVQPTFSWTDDVTSRSTVFPIDMIAGNYFFQAITIRSVGQQPITFSAPLAIGSCSLFVTVERIS
jgi:hypothetical protein